MRKAQSHHEERRDNLRKSHSKVYDEFETVRIELDTISSELQHLTNHNVHLDANFSKYGYSATLSEQLHITTMHLGTDKHQIGTYDEPNSLHSSIHENHEANNQQRDWEAERWNRPTLRFYKKPVVRQYFHKGLLWRASGSEEVASFELFVDLLYVGIIAIIGDNAAEDPTGERLLRFCITFIISWKLWQDLVSTISTFETGKKPV